ncbi:MAG TPA: glycosyltransferase family 4 protein [Bryobacteraceae bacterium]|nr:glycosyltransferase family 4 protein [Bryobacteraceae bacterium]
MRFLLINQFFVPDAAPTGQLLAHTAQALAEQGHSVRVICARAPYATGGSHDSQIPGVDVQRLACASFGHGAAARLVSYASFYAGVLRHALCGPRPDVVFTLTTPPLLSLAGALAQRLRGAQHVIWEMDLYPDVAVALAVLAQGSFVERAIGALADFSRRHSDGVIVLGPCMRDRLLARGIPPGKLRVAENWVDGALFSPRPFPPHSPLAILYSGNFGLAHDADTIAGAMARLGDPARFRFVFAGGGPRRAALQARCRAQGMGNVSFIPYQDHENLDRHFGSCHAGLVTQNPATCGALVPSKTYAFLAAGRPFIFIGPRGSTAARLVGRHACGWQIDAGDVPALESLLNLLAARPDMVRAAGARARRAFLSSYDRPAGVSRILEILTAPRPEAEPAMTSVPATSL